MRVILVLLHLVAAAAALSFALLALSYIVLAVWMLWERQIAAFRAMFLIGAPTGYVAVLVLIGLGDSFLSWRSQVLADRDLLRATVVPW